MSEKKSFFWDITGSFYYFKVLPFYFGGLVILYMWIVIEGSEFFGIEYHFFQKEWLSEIPIYIVFNECLLVVVE